MSLASRRALDRLQKRYARHAAALAEVDFMLKGSMVERFLPCGSTGCHCHADPPRLHGPYWYWSGRLQGKLVSRMLPPAQVPLYQEWMDNARRFDAIVDEMHDLSAQAAALLDALHRAKTKKSAARR